MDHKVLWNLVDLWATTSLAVIFLASLLFLALLLWIRWVLDINLSVTLHPAHPAPAISVLLTSPHLNSIFPMGIVWGPWRTIALRLGSVTVVASSAGVICRCTWFSGGTVRRVTWLTIGALVVHTHVRVLAIPAIGLRSAVLIAATLIILLVDAPIVAVAALRVLFDLVLGVHWLVQSLLLLSKEAKSEDI